MNRAPAGVLATMGIRQLPSGSSHVRFRLDHIAYAATYPTREMGELAVEPFWGRSRPFPVQTLASTV